MPRKATGSAIWRPNLGCWVAVVTSLDKSRKWIPMRKLTDPAAKDAARAQAAVVSQRWRERGCVDDSTGEVLNEYFKRWCAERELRGLASVKEDRERYAKWIADTLGTLEVAYVQPRDLERLVSLLDAHVRAELLAWKTAIHVWSIMTTLFDDAAHAKELELRVRADNPAEHVRGPYRGVERAGPWLFPFEFDALMRCEIVPANRRILYAIATYSDLRKGELTVLVWPDVHEDEGFIHTHQAHDRRTLGIKSTKGRRARKVPIEPELLPLLEGMRPHRTSALVLPTRTVASAALPIFLREDLKIAGITRRELFEDTKTTRKLCFHDLRHTYGTWRAIRGDDPQKIQWAMGHTDFKTTQRYVHEAAAFNPKRFGTPFGPLPIESLLKRCGQRFGAPKRRENKWVERDSNVLELAGKKKQNAR